MGLIQQLALWHNGKYRILGLKIIRVNKFITTGQKKFCTCGSVNTCTYVLPPNLCFRCFCSLLEGPTTIYILDLNINLTLYLIQILRVMGGFQMEFVIINQAINHITCYKFEVSHWRKIYF